MISPLFLYMIIRDLKTGTYPVSDSVLRERYALKDTICDMSELFDGTHLRAVKPSVSQLTTVRDAPTLTCDAFNWPVLAYRKWTMEANIRFYNTVVGSGSMFVLNGKIITMHNNEGTGNTELSIYLESLVSVKLERLMLDCLIVLCARQEGGDMLYGICSTANDTFIEGQYIYCEHGINKATELVDFCKIYREVTGMWETCPIAAVERMSMGTYHITHLKDVM